MPWTIGDVITETFRAFTRNWVTLVVGNLVVGLIAMLPLALWGAVTLVPLLLKANQPGGPGELFVASMVGSGLLAFVATLVLAILFAPAMSRLALAAARDERPRLSAIFDFRRARTFVGAGFLAALAIFGATLLLIVPGIIVALGLAFVSFFVVDDASLGVTASLRASWNASRGHRLHLFGLVLIGLVANWFLETVFGLSAWLAPLQLAFTLVSTPLWTLVLAQVYLRIRPQPPAAVQALAA